MEDSGNGRVKLGELTGQMGMVLDGITEIKTMIRDNDKKTNQCITDIEVNKNSIKNIKKYMWCIISSIIVSAFWIIRGALT